MSAWGVFNHPYFIVVWLPSAIFMHNNWFRSVILQLQKIHILTMIYYDILRIYLYSIFYNTYFCNNRSYAYVVAVVVTH